MSIKSEFTEMLTYISFANRIKIITLSILTLLFFTPVIYGLLGLWNTNPDYSHGFFVLPLALFILWQKRRQIIEAKSQSSWTWFPLFIVASLSYLIAFITTFHTLIYLSLLITLLFLLLFLLGWKITKSTILALIFLLFMFPIPNSIYILITNPLKIMITSISASLISLMGIPVYQDGNLLFFANTQLEVAEACSGIRSLYSYIMLSCVIALFCKKFSSKLILILSTLPLSILVNIIRVTGTGILANYYGPEVAQGFFHEFTGFVLFIIGLVALSGLYFLLEHLSIHRLRRL